MEEGPGFPIEALLWTQSRATPGTAWASDPYVMAGTVSIVGNVLVFTFVSVDFPVGHLLDPIVSVGHAYGLTVNAVEHVERISR